jgi:tellurite resistance protein TehA-like permease
MNSLLTAFSSPKATGGTVIGALATGAVTTFNWIPNDIGKLASFIAVIIAIVVLIAHIQKLIHSRNIGKLEERKLILEIEEKEKNRD